ncbi:uncharacterized protein LOC119104856 [Pollicipes pollicipes]|uniref:uncharacterized protein LOC119104856 n=1 Tax=Pollicipes pollicipes TaxID=41117 RepID=UPI0018852A3E|nr:uncharacterized protein LOC119104856 [Pollicipes pollicipes]
MSFLAMSPRAVLLLASCVLLVAAHPTKILPPPTITPPILPPPITLPPPIPLVVVQTASGAGAEASNGPGGPRVAVGTSVGIKEKVGDVTKEATANTQGQGGGGPLFANVNSGSKSKASGTNPVVADSTTTLVGTDGHALGVSQSTGSSLAGGGTHGVPPTATGVIAQSSAIASDTQTTTHTVAGTVSSNGHTVTSTVGDAIKAEANALRAKSECQRKNGGKPCKH